MRLFIQATTRAPTALTVRRGTGNNLDTLDWIPGTALRGALAAWYARNVGEAGDDRFRRLFVDGGVRYGCLRPAGSDFWPLSARLCKSEPEEHPVADRLLALAAGKGMAEHCGHLNCDAKYEVAGGFTLKRKRESGGVTHVKHELKARRITHSAIDPQLLKTRSGQLFSMRCLEVGEAFEGTVQLDDGDKTELAGIWKESEKLVLRLGAARSRGQGEVELRWFDQKADTAAIQRRLDALQKQAAGIGGRLAGKSVLAVTLQAPAVVRDEYLLSRLWLEAADLGLDPGWELMGWFSRTWTISGWHAAAAVPRTESAAIAPGSCFLFGRDTAAVSLPDLAKWAAWIEEHGVGERRIEGMGEVRVCQAIHAEHAEGG